jgi:hypothetical protein
MRKLNLAVLGCGLLVAQACASDPDDPAGTGGVAGAGTGAGKGGSQAGAGSAGKGGATAGTGGRAGNGGQAAGGSTSGAGQSGGGSSPGGTGGVAGGSGGEGGSEGGAPCIEVVAQPAVDGCFAPVPQELIGCVHAPSGCDAAGLCVRRTADDTFFLTDGGCVPDGYVTCTTEEEMALECTGGAGGEGGRGESAGAGGHGG